MTASRRDIWERQWQQHSGEEFGWYLKEVPSELRDLLARPDHPSGAVLDVGCGNGVATAFLAEHLRPAVGVDIALAAVRQARDLALGKGVRAWFLVAEAPMLPFRDGSFGLVFDRGCLQAVPRPGWPTYFAEVDRLLHPGGMLQLFVSRPVRSRPRLLSARGIRARIRRRTRPHPGGPSFLSASLVRELVPATMQELRMDEFEFTTKGGQKRIFIHGLYRKAA
jgi:SAM-dependent methyltransferase